MIKDVKIGDQTVAMAANAATPFRYAGVFHEDPLRRLSQIQEGKADQADAAEIFMKLAFIMAMQGAGRDMAKLREEDFYAWLEQYEYMDIVASGNEIAGIYFAQTKTLSVAKKKDD